MKGAREFVRGSATAAVAVSILALFSSSALPLDSAFVFFASAMWGVITLSSFPALRVQARMLSRLERWASRAQSAEVAPGLPDPPSSLAPPEAARGQNTGSPWDEVPGGPGPLGVAAGKTWDHPEVR